MKRLFAILILSSFVSAMTFTFVPAFAEEPKRETDKIKVYYSESIGGEKVYRLTACNKIRAWAPVQCTKEYVANHPADWGTQCDANDDIGAIIKGCEKKDASKNVIKIMDGDDPTVYPEVDLKKYTQKAGAGGCSDKPEAQAYLYAPMYAIVDKTKVKEPNQFNESLIEGTVSIPEGLTITLPTENITKPMYQTGVCASWDVIPGEAYNMDKTYEEALALLQKVGPEGQEYAAALIDEGCDNNAHSSKLDPYPAVRCSSLERLSGESGSALFSKYIGVLYRWAAGLVGIVSVLTIVYSGIQISMAGGDSAKLDSAKNRIMQSIIGLVILFLSGLILYTINPTFFAGG